MNESNNSEHKPTLEELKEIFRLADEEYQKISKAYRDERYEKIGKIEKALSDKYREKTNHLYKNFDTARNNLKKEEERIEISKAVLKYPPGTILNEWINRYYGTSYEWKKTGQVGVEEIVTRESKFRQNMRYGVPRIGSCVIRLLKKDGTVSKDFTYNHYNKWLPESENPNPPKPTEKEIQEVQEANIT